MTSFRDQQLEEELLLEGLDPKAAERAFDDLVAYLNTPIEEIAREYWHDRATDDAVAQERVARARDESTVMTYYQNTRQYLYELSYWEATHDKQAWLHVLARACRRRGLRTVLDYGGGVGGACLSLQGRGVRCAYLDVAGQTFEYAAWRFKRWGLDIPMFNVMDGMPREQFDAVMAYDVFEHVFDLDATIAVIARLIYPNGWLLSKSTFADPEDHHLHIHLAKHACYQEVVQFNALLSRHGFRYLGQLKPNRLSRILRTCGFRYAVTGIRISPRLKYGGNFLVHERVD